MVQQRVRRNGTSSAFLWGGVFGAVAVVFTLLGGGVAVGRAVRLLRGSIRPFAGVTLVGIVLSLAVIGCYFVAGLLAARRARGVEPGIFAGLIAGGIAGLGVLVVAIIGTAMARHGVRMGGTGRIGGIRTPRLVAGILAAAVGRMIAAAVVGTGVGALGALVGRPRGNPPVAGGGYPYQAGPMTPAMGTGSMPGAMPYSAGGSYGPQTPVPPSYSAEDSMPTMQTDSTPPTP